ncbi:helix-turn-helix domain-containing protein [Streptomyces sp. NPDC058171]
MLRIHFTARDLLNVRIARQPDPLWELMCSVCRIQTREGPVDFDPWRDAARRVLRADPLALRSLHVLRTVIPPLGYIPDFLTPAPDPAGAELAAGLDLVRATPRTRRERELAGLSGARRPSGRLAALTGSDGPALLTDALRTYHDGLLGPHWARVRAAVENDVRARTHGLLSGGTQALLDGLRPFARWRPPVLEVDFPVARDLFLAGRGLLLLPSYFCWRRPTALADPDLRPVLVYPVVKTPFDAGAATADGVVRLLGRTRAAVLARIADGRTRTTSEVAAAVGVSLPSTSHQIGVLREGGLITSRRDGQYVVHTATPLGLNLLGAAAPPGPGSAPVVDDGRSGGRRGPTG